MNPNFSSRSVSNTEESFPFSVIGYGFAAGPVSFTINSATGTRSATRAPGPTGKSR